MGRNNMGLLKNSEKVKTTSARSYIYRNDDMKVVQPRLGLNIDAYYTIFYKHVIPPGYFFVLTKKFKCKLFSIFGTR